MHTMPAYPLLFEPSLHVKVWGGRQLATRLGKTLPTDEPYGESWEIFWQNRVINGPLAGHSLSELIAADPVALCGSSHAGAEFPLLIKFLDAQDWLSVQVHPDDTMALQIEGEPRGKTECWYIIDASPGAQIAYGLAEPLDAAGFRAAIREGRTREVIQYVPVAPGDFVFVPAGMQHAIGPGILLYELQQTSDTTYRVYDWDRMGLDGKPRTLHLDKALAVTTFAVSPPAKRPYSFVRGEGFEVASLIRGQYFNLDRLRLTGSCPRDTAGAHPHLLSVVHGETILRGEGFSSVHLPLGASVFVPAGVGAYEIGAGDEAHESRGAEVLCAWPS
jgi:mannose-6-phosphate isomerase